MTENELSKIIVNSCYKVHTTLGPGLLESVYEEVLAFELLINDFLITVKKEYPLYMRMLSLTWNSGQI